MCRRAQVYTDESTPPDMATAMVFLRPVLHAAGKRMRGNSVASGAAPRLLACVACAMLGGAVSERRTDAVGLGGTLQWVRAFVACTLPMLACAQRV